MDKDHILIWSDLYDFLTTEEFNVFYHALEHEKYSTETAIVTQGEEQWRLFFVNKGSVKLFSREKGNEVLVQVVNQGDVFGGSSFFDNSVWTLNATSLGAVGLSTLSMEKVEEWGGIYPALETKMQEYCHQFDQVNDFSDYSGVDRREEERHIISNAVSMAVFDDNGKNSDITMRGECSDISTGGLFLHVKTIQKKQSSMLLGRHVSVLLTDDHQSRGERGLGGTVVAVCKQDAVGLGCVVHVCFDTELEKNVLAGLIDGS